jgi:hypothetical protein
MLDLTDEQLKQVKAAAAPIPARLRETYLQRIGLLLQGRVVNQVSVRWARAATQNELLGLVHCDPSCGDDAA